MSTPALHPDALFAKYATLKHWRAIRPSRREALGGWQFTRGEDGRLHVSAQVRGPNAGEALQKLMDRQARFLSRRTDRPADDAMPQMDLTQQGRVAVFWRLAGVWVEVWYRTADSALVSPVQPVPVPVRRGLGLGGRLPYTRNRRTKESIA
jgi:hypothetical protein